MTLETANGDALDTLAVAAANDEAAFERLVRRCYLRLHRWALVATGDPDEAEDVVQETLLRMHRFIGGYRRGSRFTTWAYRITMSAAADVHRGRAGRTRKLLRFFHHTRDAVAAGTRAEPDIDARRQAELVRSFWQELPPAQQRIFDLADLQGFRPEEIAEMLAMNPATVRAHLFKARRTLRSLLLQALPAGAREES